MFREGLGIPHAMLLEIAPKYQWNNKLSKDPTVDPLLLSCAHSLLTYTKYPQTVGLVPVSWSPTRINFVALDSLRTTALQDFPYLDQVPNPPDQAHNEQMFTYLLTTIPPEESYSPLRLITIEYLRREDHRKRLEELITIPQV